MDVYFKKEITYPFGEQKFKFDVGESLFSTFGIDHGTDILLRSIVLNNPQTILDLGCGYGPIGIVLAKINPQAQIKMVDRDLLALRFAKANIEKNNLKNVEVLGSVGMESLGSQIFDLIVSNVPAKIGDRAITQDFILVPYEHLKPGGQLWLVVVNALNRLIPKVGSQNNLNVKEIRKRAGHTVYKITKPKDFKPENIF